MDANSHTSPRPRILLVEDDPDIARLVALHLEELEVSFEHSARGDTGLERALSEDWSLLILDIRLPGTDGIDICKSVRSHGMTTPILMLTSKSSELDRVLGLEIGADDYISKPFSPLELVARIKATLRRASMNQSLPSQGGVIRCGPFVINSVEHIATLDDIPLEVTAKEFELLRHFAQHPGRVFKRAELLDEVWGYGHDGYEHTVNSHINRLRGKIEPDPAKPRRIATVWGVGYKFQPDS